MNPKDYGIKVIPCETVDDFWDTLSPQNQLFNAPILYRGQRDATWSLTPKALRKGNIVRNDYTDEDDDVFGYLRGELRLFKRFVESCDQGALPITHDSRMVRQKLTDSHLSRMIAGKSVSHWPDEDLFPLMALAQHYDLPTRLLDWSKRSYVAAFFAAQSSLSSKKPAKEICVWALDATSSTFTTDHGTIAVAPGAHWRCRV